MLEEGPKKIIRSSKPIRYIVVHLFNDYSGSPRVLADFCKSEAIQSESLSVVTSSSKGFLEDELGEKTTIWYPRGRFRLLNYCSFALSQVQLFFVSFFLILRSWLRREKVVLVNNTILSLGSMLASKITSTKNIAYIHEINSGPRVFRNVAEFLIRWTADHVIFVSQFVADDYNFKDKSTLVLPNGLRADFEESITLDHAQKFDQQTVLFVGSLKEYKGVNELLVIAGALPDTPFIGIFNTSNTILREFQQSKRVPPNLKLMTHQADIQKSYEHAFLVMNLSLPEQWIESFALTVLEGMAYGCPCIVPPVGGHLSYFDVGSGLICDAKNTDKIVAFIEALREDKALWRQHSDHAQKAASKFTASQYSSNVKKVLDQIIAPSEF
jgi:glycosyltransferase involved in cell wall biosynthesis